MQRISININVASADARNVRALMERVLGASEAVRGYSLAVWPDDSGENVGDRARNERRVMLRDYERKMLARIATTMAPRE